MRASPSLTYALGRSLYVPLTSRTNSVSLPKTRGPSFSLPPDVLTSLEEVRRLELLGDAGEGGLQPSVDRLVGEIRCRLGLFSAGIGDGPSSPSSPPSPPPPYDALVFAGEGEPTLRLPTLLSVVGRIVSSPYSSTSVVPKIVRVVTNGLVRSLPGNSDGDEGGGACCLKRMREAGVTDLSVALMTSCAEQYDLLMRPHLPEEDEALPPLVAHGAVCSFVADAVAAGLAVEVTAVGSQGVNRNGLEDLARELGVREAVRWRPYFP